MPVPKYRFGIPTGTGMIVIHQINEWFRQFHMVGAEGWPKSLLGIIVHGPGPMPVGFTVVSALKGDGISAGPGKTAEIIQLPVPPVL